MQISSTRGQGFDYAPCRYNGSRLWFRGPRRTLRAPYVVCMGGSDVYGRFLTQPWPSLLEAQIGCPVANMGVENAGIDAYLNDPGALMTAANAAVVVLQLGCSHNTSNRFYSVHPRRNDRFLRASKQLETLYPEMDFTEVHFTRHLLSRLFEICPERFEIVAGEARSAWRARAKSLFKHMNGALFLFWFASKPMVDETATAQIGEPFLTRSAVESLSPYAQGLIELVPDNWRAGIDDLAIPPLERSRAAHLAGPAAHRAAADRVASAIQVHLE